MSSREGAFKIVLLGDSASKTTLVNRYLTKIYDESVKMTIGADFYVKDLEIDGKKLVLRIWDLGGEPRFKVLLPSFTKGADGALVIYDVTNYSSIAHIDDWLDIIRKENRAEVPILLLGIILDEKKKRQVSAEEGKKIAKSRNLNGHIECNLKTGKNVEKAFDDLTRLILTSPQFCHKCQKEFTFEEFLIHPCYTSGDVLSTGVVNVIGIVMRKLKQRRFWPLKNSKVIAAAIVQGNDTILYSTDKWDFSDDFTKFLSTLNSIKAKSIKISGVKYTILQSTSRRFVATANKGKTHIVGAKERDKTLLLYLKPNGKVAFDPVKEKFYIIQSLKDEESKKKSDKGFDDEREKKKGRNKRYLAKKERRKKEEAKDEEYLITYTRHLEKRLRNLETENQLLNVERFKQSAGANIDSQLKGEVQSFLQWIKDSEGLLGYINYYLQQNNTSIISELSILYSKLRQIFGIYSPKTTSKPPLNSPSLHPPPPPKQLEDPVIAPQGKEFRIYDLENTGDRTKLNITPEELKYHLNPKNVLIIIRDDLRKIFVWKGAKSSVRKRFISARIAQDLQRDLIQDAQYHRCKIVSITQGDELQEFLDAFRLESMEVAENLPDMRYPRNFERDKGDFKFLEEKLNNYIDTVERMMSVILRIPDLVDQSLATVNHKLSTLESRINGTTNQKSTTITKKRDQSFFQITTAFPEYLRKSLPKEYDDDDERFPYPYIFRPPEPPDDVAVAPRVQLKASQKKKDSELKIHCQYCGKELTKEKQSTHSCKKKP